MTRITNTNTETYRNVDIDSTYWNDGSFEITINSSDDILEFGSLKDAHDYVDGEYLKYPYIDLAVDIYNYQYYVHPFEGVDMNIFDIAKDLNDINQVKSYIEWIEDDISDTEYQPYLDMANDILPKLYALQDYIEKHSYYTNFDLVDAFIGIKDISDFEPTSEGLIDIWEYLSKVAALLKARYEQHKRNVPTFEFYEELWWDGLDDGETPEEIFDSLLQITIEIDF